MYSYSSLEKKAKTLASIINAPERLLPQFGQSNQAACPFVLISFPYFYLVVSENGTIIEKKKFLTEDMLLYSIFERITFNMAMEYEVVHRAPNQDFRRILFSYQLVLMQRLSDAWKKRLQEKIDDILCTNPFSDD